MSFGKNAGSIFAYFIVCQKMLCGSNQESRFSVCVTLVAHTFFIFQEENKMKFTFNTATFGKEWTVTEDRITFKNKDYLFSEMSKVVHDIAKDELENGCISFYYKGLLKYITYKRDQQDNAQKAYEYILSVVSGEDKANQEKMKYEREEKIKKDGYKKRCNICGHIFCYTLDDLKKNKELKAQKNLGLFTAFTGGMSGHYAAGATSIQTANDAESRMIDYDKCPACGSRDLQDITEENISTIKQTQNNTAYSSADELKKFKELLDMGVITQEEFDAKKKQLLGL